ncbi:MAG: hypothetical protein HY725_13920 [Candidatus Rokubacteria bacterium]|nr:hypothetical protein [Candidatus Rokubacteria bacterium]
MRERSRLGSAILTLLLAGAVLGGAACSTTRRDLRIGTGFISYMLCAGVFVSRLSPEQVRADSITPLLRKGIVPPPVV